MALWLLPAVKEGGALCQNHEKIQKAEYLGKGRDRDTEGGGKKKMNFKKSLKKNKKIK